MIFLRRWPWRVLPVLFFLPCFAGFYLLHREPPPEADIGFMVAVGGSAAHSFFTEGWGRALYNLYFNRVGSGSLQSVPFGLAWMLTGGSDMESRLIVQLPVLFLFGFFVWRSFSLRLSPWRALGATAFLLSFPFLADEAIGCEHLTFFAFGTMALYFLWRSEFFTRPWALVGAFAGVAGAMAHRVPETLVYLLPLIGLYVIEAARRRHLRTRDVFDVSLASALIFSILVYWSFFYWYCTQIIPYIPFLLGTIGVLCEVGRRRGVPAGLRNFVAAVLAFSVVAFAPFASDVFLWIGQSLLSRWSELARPSSAVGGSHYFMVPVLLALWLLAFKILTARPFIARMGGFAMAIAVLWNLSADKLILEEKLSRSFTPEEIFNQISESLPKDSRELRIGVAGAPARADVDSNALWLRALRLHRNWHFTDISMIDLGAGIGSPEKWETCLNKELDYLILFSRGDAVEKIPVGGLSRLFVSLSELERGPTPVLKKFATLPRGDGSSIEIYKGDVAPGTIDRAGAYFFACDEFGDQEQPSTPVKFMWEALRGMGSRLASLSHGGAQ